MLPTNIVRGSTGHVAFSNSVAGKLNRYIDSGDYATIQAAIDAADTANVPVYIPAGTHSVTATLTLPANVEMIMAQGADLRPATDIDVIRMYPGSKISGGKITTSYVAGYTSDCILLHADDIFDFKDNTLIENVSMIGTVGAGTGIHLLAEQRADHTTYIFGVEIKGCRFYGFNIGLHIHAVLNDPVSAWWSSVNACTYSNLFFWACTNAINIQADDPTDTRLNGAGGSTFGNIQIQPDSASLSAIHCGSSHNLFMGVFIWDWHSLSLPGSTYPAITIDQFCTRNMFYTNINPVYTTDAGTDNFIFSPSSPTGVVVP